MTIKLPLKTSFAFLCGYVATLRKGLTIVEEGRADNETALDKLKAAIIASTVLER